MPGAEVGFQPRNTPAERRAFFDINRRLKELEAAGGVDLSDYYTKVEADGRFVNVPGDEMTGRLTIKQDTTVPLRLLSGTAGSASIYGRDAANAVNNGRVSFFDSGGVALASERTDQPVKVLVNNVDKITAGPSDVTMGVPVVVAAQPGNATGLRLNASTDVVSERIQLALGDWTIGQDYAANGTKDLYVWNPTNGNTIRIGTDGRVTLLGDPTAALHAVTKQYVDAVDGTITATSPYVLSAGFENRLTRQGSMVTLIMTMSNGGSASGANPNVATIPAGFRPAASQARGGAWMGATAVGVQVSSGGVVQFLATSIGAGVVFAFSITYKVA